MLCEYQQQTSHYCAEQRKERKRSIHDISIEKKKEQIEEEKTKRREKKHDAAIFISAELFDQWMKSEFNKTNWLTIHLNKKRIR